MRKAWSLFWLVVASAVAFSIISQMIQPYLGVIAIVVVAVTLVAVGVVIYRYLRRGRRHF